MKRWHLEDCWQTIRLTAHGAIRLMPHFVTAASTLLFSHPATAQIIPDSTAGTTETPSVEIKGIVSDRIDGGTIRGNNLFHSFSEFNIQNGRGAYFTNPEGITNIFSRITGNNPSNINGILGVLGNANLFLLNPNGIIFGANAKLDLNGSFFGTTANSIQFADGMEFSAKNPTGTPLLTVSVPIGLQFGQNPGGITVQGTGHRITGGAISPFDRRNNPAGLQVKTGNMLALVGGEIAISGGILAAPDGKIALGSIGQNNTTSIVQLEPSSQSWNLNYNAIQQFGDINLSQAALLDASSGGAFAQRAGWHIALQGRNISLQNGSLALIQNLGNTPAGNIQVKASGLLSIAGISLDGRVRSSLENQTVGAGNGGDIQISVSDVAIAEGAGILTRSFGAGTTGNIIVNASGQIQVAGFIPGSNANSIIGSLVFSSGNAGNIQVTADRLTLLAAGNITASTIGKGRGGNVEVNATSIAIAGFNPLTQSISNIGSATFGVGDSGSVTVNANRLILRDRGKITTGGFAQGNAGSLVVNATESIDISDQLTTIDSSIEILPAATRAAFFLPDIPSGNAGSVTVNTPILRIDNRGQVSVRNDGTGNAGSLQINGNRVELNRQAAITASTRSGQGGNIILSLHDVAIARQNSSINTESTGIGNGGNITISAAAIVGLENSDIIANAFQGNGGNIQIATQGIFGLQNRSQLTSGSDISASSQFGLSGTVNISVLNVNQQNVVAPPPSNFVSTDQVVASSCLARQGNSQGILAIAGNGGLPETPETGTLPYEVVQVQSVPTQPVSSSFQPSPDAVSQDSPSWKFGDPIVEATEFSVNARGQVVLTAKGYSAAICHPARCANAQPHPIPCQPN